ncbi:MAG: hypothetical protein JNL82_16090 [Myxococcales bacterium]|nr:hypothetical protein [Myxococcales bacterium]
MLAEHRAQLAQHAVMMEAILAEHRRAQAQADEARGQQLADHRRAQAEAAQEHRQQLAELLARHRDEVQAAAAATGEQAQAVASLRELLAQQADAMQAEHARVGDKLESIVDIVGIVGETVHHIAAAALQPRMPRFSAPPPPLAEAKPTPPAGEQAPASAATCAPRLLPARPAASPPSSAVQRTSPSTPAPHVAVKAEQATLQSPDAQPAIAAAVPSSRGPAGTTPDPATSPSPLHAAPKNAASCASTAPRSLGFTPASTVLTLVNTEFTLPLTPRERRAEQEARERSRLHDVVSSIPDDDPMFADDSETGDAAEGGVSRG